MDRNQIIGIVLILGMLLGYQLLVPKPAPEKKPEQEKATSAPSPETAKKAEQPLDSAASRMMYGDFAAAAVGQSRDIVVENPEIRVTFSTQGGRVKEVVLKNYKTFDQKPLVLINEQSSEMVMELPTNRGKVNIEKLYFETSAPAQSTVQGSAQTITFKLALSPTESVEQTYTIPATGYVVDYDLKLNGMDKLLANSDIRFFWLDRMRQFENDMAENRKSATINYLSADENFDGLSEGANDQEATVEEPVKWFTIKHKYFLAGFISENSPFKKAAFKTLVNPGDSSTVKTAIADVQIPLADVKSGKGNYRFYFGPNDYQLLDEVAPEFDRNVYLGYALLKPVNKYFFVPVFNILEKFISNYGLLIIVLVVFVKLLLTPLTYRSYVSMAKMRVLGPEVNAIREKVGDDMAKQQQETMKLYQQVGVSPLSGCIPVLATMPVLMSLFFLFPNLIELRQQPFLWSSDLSTYDSFIKFPFSIPFLGSHLSLFTVFMTGSSLAYAYYNNQMTPAQPNSPINMKAMGYVFPLMFMFVLNSFPAGLTFYYFVSNVVTIAQQLLIRKFVDEDKIKAVLEENRKKFAKGDVKKSKFQDILQRSLQQAEEAKKQAEEAKKRTKK
ncbi:membrane protein insertase YidC [Larkinella terrae]|uniref:Membrane protein insertase YidC n=1 Tax=Larkinella terrae TaxID=2025311 RepID=A0A7K0EQ53_9BACT|nr:membrane protein insertase YidC [Larkinella terrae]MRS63963.1 membrane protein insertase YidC [Larkinella terrae]